MHYEGLCCVVGGFTREREMCIWRAARNKKIRRLNNNGVLENVTIATADITRQTTPT